MLHDTCTEKHPHTNSTHMHKELHNSSTHRLSPQISCFHHVDTRWHPIFCCKNIFFLACIGVILDRLIWAYWVAFALGWSPAIFFLVGRSRFIANPRHRSMDGEWRSELRKEHFGHRSLQYLKAGRSWVWTCVGTWRISVWTYMHAPMCLPCVHFI